MSTDRIDKQILLRAPRERVWRAVSDAQAFGTWFGVAFDGPFVEGARLTGKIVPTKMDEAIAKMQEPYTGKAYHWTVERIEPMQRISFRWHPYAVEEGVDYSKEPTTLIEFVLEDAPGGILLKISESGFDQLPLARRAKAFKANEGGWEMQTHLIEKYLAQTS
ncbi:MAG TPA: SRPBCC family protein [Candidatus Acidoferrales bacterium]|nr:SRPBCC family protein [Candidatus Acidoferrales bacterium]